MSNPKVEWPGASGKKYLFEVFTINVDFTPNITGNYIFAKPTPKGWDAVYIGEGDLQTRTHDEIHRKCAIKKGATQIHAHKNTDEKLRKFEESDLLAYHTEAYEPTGCNIKVGG